MIPALATIVSAYIVFRMLEVFAFAGTRYSNTAARVIMCVLALLVIAVVGLNLADIWSAGMQAIPGLPH